MALWEIGAVDAISSVGRGKRQARDKNSQRRNSRHPFTTHPLVAGGCFWVGMELNLKAKLT